MYYLIANELNLKRKIHAHKLEIVNVYVYARAHNVNRTQTVVELNVVDGAGFGIYYKFRRLFCFNRLFKAFDRQSQKG